MRMKEQEQPKKGPHPDYSINLEDCKNFMLSVRPTLIREKLLFIDGRDINFPELLIYIGDSGGIKQCLFYICYTPPMSYPQGNYAAAIFLHQDKRAVSDERQKIFNGYYKMAKDCMLKIQEEKKND
jgi:hypothetical protein